jgi:hypothetical protein
LRYDQLRLSRRRDNSIFSATHFVSPFCPQRDFWLARDVAAAGPLGC